MSNEGLVFFSARGHGSRTAWVTALSYGTDIYGEESETAHATQFYPHHVLSTAFTVEVTYSDWDEWNELMDWMESYARKLCESSSSVGLMYVQIPSVKFSQVGIPVSGMDHGDDLTPTYVSTIRFAATAAPFPSATGLPTLPTDSTVRQFFPSGLQLTAKDREVDIYDGVTPLSQDRLLAIAQQSMSVARRRAAAGGV